MKSYHKLILLSAAVLSFSYLEYIGVISPDVKAHLYLESPQAPSQPQKVAFNMDRAAPNEMTPEKSEEMLEVQRENGIITDDSGDNSSPLSPTSSSNQDEPTETNAAQPHKFDIQNAKQNQKKLYSRNDTDKAIQTIIITILTVIVITGIAFLAIRAKKNKKKK